MRPAEEAATLRSIALLQLPSGMIPWARGHHGDPWNHTEAVIALAAGGFAAEAAAGLSWLSGAVNRDGSFCQYFLASGVKEPRIDLNCCLYPAVGILSYLLFSGDVAAVRSHVGWFDATTAFVLGFQREDGSFPWALDPDRRALAGSLKAGSSAMVIALEAIEALDDLLGRSRGRIKEAREALVSSIASSAEGFLDKSQWAMDAYYPVLAGAVSGDAAREMLEGLKSRHLIAGHGIRALSSSEWVTAAETAEAAMAFIHAGEQETAEALLAAVGNLRQGDGSYLTGRVLPGLAPFPAGECSTYSAAAVVLAHRVLSLHRRVGIVEALIELGDRAGGG